MEMQKIQKITKYCNKFLHLGKRWKSWCIVKSKMQQNAMETDSVNKS